MRTGNAPRTAPGFRNLVLDTFRLAGRANIAYARRDLRDRHDPREVFGVCGSQQIMIKFDMAEQK